jgi:lipopolysaccharide exporter
LVVRTLGFQLLTAVVTILLARLLTPADYGLFAIALSIQLIGMSIAELGLPAALVRMSERPSDDLLAATIGFLLTLTVGAVGLIMLAAFVVVPSLGGTSRVMQVIAITLLALPLYAVRAVPMAMMDRGMHFGRVAAVEAADTAGFNAFALSAAVVGSASSASPAPSHLGRCWGCLPPGCFRDLLACRGSPRGRSSR